MEDRPYGGFIETFLLHPVVLSSYKKWGACIFNGWCLFCRPLIIRTYTINHTTGNMRKILVPACLLAATFSSTSLFASNAVFPMVPAFKASTDTLPATNEAADKNLSASVFEMVEVEAQFDGGDNGWRSFLMANLNPDVPVKNNAPAGKYMVVVQFIVNKDGTISDIKPLTNYGYGMEREVVRILKQSPKWQPAQQNGRYVNAYRKQPITFVVEEAKKKKRLF